VVDDTAFDTTVDTTQSATRSNRAQPRATNPAFIGRFCNFEQRPETGVVGLWLRRARVEVPSATVVSSTATKESGGLGKLLGQVRARRAGARINAGTLPASAWEP
jgi:hypothetical protein